MLGCSSLPRALSVRKAHLHTSRTVRSQISSVVDVLEARKLVQATTSRALKDHLQTKHATSTFLPRTIYSGVDPSAISLHVGNLLPLIALLHCSLHGHNSLVLVSTKIDGLTSRSVEQQGPLVIRQAARQSAPPWIWNN